MIEKVRECKGCTVTVWHPFAEIEAQMEEYLQTIEPEARVTGQQYAARLAECDACAGLYYESTCIYCGCFVRMRALRKNRGCPHPKGPKWSSVIE